MIPALYQQRSDAAMNGKKNNKTCSNTLYQIEKNRYDRSKSGFNTLIPYRRLIERVFTGEKQKHATGALTESIRILLNFLSDPALIDHSENNFDLHISVRIGIDKASLLPLVPGKSNTISTPAYSLFAHFRMKIEEILENCLELNERILLCKSTIELRSFLLYSRDLCLTSAVFKASSANLPIF